MISFLEQKERRIRALEKQTEYLREEIKTLRARLDMKPQPEIRVVGTKRGSNLHYVLCVDQVEHMENGILVRVFL